MRTPVTEQPLHVKKTLPQRFRNPDGKKNKSEGSGPWYHSKKEVTANSGTADSS